MGKERFLNQKRHCSWQDTWGKYLLLTLPHSQINCRLIRCCCLVFLKEGKKRARITPWSLDGVRALGGSKKENADWTAHKNYMSNVTTHINDKLQAEKKNPHD